MYEGIKVQNGGKLVDLNDLPKTENGELILDGVDSLKVFVEGNAKYDQANLEILENNSDVKISFKDAEGNDVFLILKGLNEILLTNNTELPVFEVFEGTEKLASMTTIDDLEAAAAGGETLSSDQTGNPAGTGALEGTDSGDIAGRVAGLNALGLAGPDDPTFAYDVTFGGDNTLILTEDVGQSEAGIISGLITATDPHYPDLQFIPQTTTTEYGVFTLDADGNWTYDLFEDNEDVQGLTDDESLLDSIVIQIEGEVASFDFVVTINGLNDKPEIEDINVNTAFGEDIYAEEFYGEDRPPIRGLGEDDQYYPGEDGPLLESALLETHDAYGEDGTDDDGNNIYSGPIAITDADYNNTHTLYIDSVDVIDNSQAGVTYPEDISVSLVPDGSGGWEYAISGDFSELSVGEELTLNISYYADDNSRDDLGNPYEGDLENDDTTNEDSRSDIKVITLTITGTNDQPVVEHVVDYDDKSAVIIENSMKNTPDEPINTITGTLTAIDDDTNDNHFFNLDYLRQGMEFLARDGANYSNDYQNISFDVRAEYNYDGSGSVIVESNDIDASEIDIQEIRFLNNDSQDSQVNFALDGDFKALGVGETATVTFKYYADDQRGFGEYGNNYNEASRSEPQYVTITVEGTNDQPVVRQVNGNIVSELKTWDFDDGIPADLSVSGGTTVHQSYNGSWSSGSDQVVNFVESGTRSLTMENQDTSSGGKLSFDFIYGNGRNGGEQVDNGEEVVFEYSLDNGNTWIRHTEFDLNTYQNGDWHNISIDLVGDLSNSDIDLRLLQKNHSGSCCDHWAINNLEVGQSIVTPFYETHDNDAYSNDVDDTQDDVMTKFSGSLVAFAHDDDVNDTLTYFLDQGSVAVNGVPIPTETIVLGQMGDEDPSLKDWGEKVNNHTRVVELDNGMTITTVSDSGKLKQYDSNTDHKGQGIGDKDGNGIQDGETITVTFAGGQVNSATFGFAGLGGHFDENGSEQASATWIAYNNGVEVERGTVQTDGIATTATINSTEAFDMVEFSTDSETSSDWVLTYVEAEVLPLEVVVDQNGEYDIEGNFNYLADGETATVTFDYYVEDDQGITDPLDPNHELSRSGVETVTLTITGTNDQPIVDAVVLGMGEDVIYETHDGEDIIGADDTQDENINILMGRVSVSDEDLTDTHTFNVLDMAPVQEDASIALQTISYDDGIATTTDADIAVQVESDAVNVSNITISAIRLLDNDSADRTAGFELEGDFSSLAEGETATVTFAYNAVDDSGVVNESGTSETKTVSITVTGTNDQPIVENMVMGAVSFENSTDMRIPGAGSSGTIRSEIEVTDLDSIEDLNVSININHTWDADLDIFLVSPNGTRVELTTDNGGWGNNFRNTEFNDEADSSIRSGRAPFNGTFRPEGDLSDFDGLSGDDLNGTWTLVIRDDAGGDVGRLFNWGLEFNSETIFETYSEVDAPLVDDTAAEPVNTLVGTLSVTDQDLNDTHTFNILDMAPVQADDDIEIQTITYDDGIVTTTDLDIAVQVESDDVDVSNITISAIRLLDNDGDLSTNFELDGDFSSLAAGETATVTFAYNAVDSSSNAINPGETNTSETKTVTITVTGTNDQPVVAPIVLGADTPIYETNDTNDRDDYNGQGRNWDNDNRVTQNDEFINALRGQLTVSDADDNDGHIFDVVNTDLNGFVSTLDQAVLTDPNYSTHVEFPVWDFDGNYDGGRDRPVSMVIESSDIDASEIDLDRVEVRSNDGIGREVDFTLFGDFTNLAAGEHATVTFTYNAIDDSATHLPGETNLSEPKTVTITVTGTNDEPVIEEVWNNRGNFETTIANAEDRAYDNVILAGGTIAEAQAARIAAVTMQEQDGQDVKVEIKSSFVGFIDGQDDDLTDTHTLHMANTTDTNTIAVQTDDGEFLASFSSNSQLISASDIKDLSIDFRTILDNQDSEVQEYSYLVNGNFSALGKGENIHIEFSYYAKDDSNVGVNGESDQSDVKVIHITIEGTNDQPVVIEYDHDVEVQETNQAIEMSTADLQAVAYTAAYTEAYTEAYDAVYGDVLDYSTPAEEFAARQAATIAGREAGEEAGDIASQAVQDDDTDTLYKDTIIGHDDDINDKHLLYLDTLAVSDPSEESIQIGFRTTDGNVTVNDVSSGVFTSSTSSVTASDISGLNILFETTSDVQGETSQSYDYTVVGDFNALAEGESATVTFKYFVGDDSNATNETNESDFKEVTLTITGTNDKPVVTANKVYDAVEEADGTNTVTTADAPEVTIIRHAFDRVNDDDNSDTHEFNIESPAGNEIDTANGFVLLQTPVMYINNDGELDSVFVQVKLPAGVDANDISINSIRVIGGEFVIEGKFDALSGPLGQNLADELQIKFKYFADDQNDFDGTDGSNESSISDSEFITVKVTGTNDKPAIEVNPSDNRMVEDSPLIVDNDPQTPGVQGDLTTLGSLRITDVDHGQSSFDTTSETFISGTNNIDLGGTLSIAANGDWTYAVDNATPEIQALQLGESIQQTYQVASFDGTATQTITVSIHGTNDKPIAVDDSSIQNGAILSVEDFENGATGWSNNLVTETNTNATDFLGRFAASNGNEAVSKTYSFGEEHAGKTVTIEFDMLEIDSWDNEYFKIFINGVEEDSYLLSHFGRQTDIDDGGTPIDNIGSSGRYYLDNDESHHYSVVVTLDANGDVTLGFGSTLNSGVSDESFGIDNIIITAGDDWTITTEENTAILIDVLANDTDVDTTDTKMINDFDSSPTAGGTVTQVGTQLQFDPGSDFDDLAEGESREVTFTYEMKDSGDLTDTATVIILVTGTNDLPVATVQTGILNDTTAPDSLALSVDVVTDDRAADTNDLSEIYFVEPGSVSMDAVSGIDMNDLTAVLNADGKTIDFTAGSAFDYLDNGESVTVTIHYNLDDGTQSVPSTLVLTINGTNDLPIIEANQVFNINEHDALNHASYEGIESNEYDLGESLAFNEGNGALVGQFVATDVEGDNLGYEILSVNGLISGDLGFPEIFHINSNGKIYLVDNVDAEVQDLYTLEVRVTGYNTDGSANYATDTVTVNVADLNDNVPVLTVSGVIVDVDENSQGTTLATLSVADADGTPPNAVQAIGNFTVTGADAALVEVVDNAGVFELRLKTDADLDYEVPNHNLDVNVVYNDGLHDSNSEVVSIAVNDLNDNAPVLTYTEVLSNVDENSVGTTLGTLSVADADGTPPNAVQAIGNFTITGADAALVEIVDNAGVFELRLKADAVVNYEEPNINLDVTVVYNDGDNDSNIATVSVAVNDINEAPVAVDDGLEVIYANASLIYENDFGGDGQSGVFNKTTSDAEVNTGIHSNQTGSTSYTMIAWVNPEGGVDSGAFRGRESIISTDSQNGGYDWGISIDSDYFSVFTGAGFHNVAPVAYDTWQQVATVFDTDTNTYKMFLNGVEIASGVLTSSNFDSNTGNFMVGENPSTAWAEHFSGEMSNVKIFEGVLTADEIEANYNKDSISYIEENDTVLIDVLANDFDVDAGDTISINNFDTTTSNGGTVTLVGTQLQFDPGSDFDYLTSGETVVVTFEYDVRDVAGLVSDKATVTLTITGTNDAPVLNVYSSENLVANGSFEDITGPLGAHHAWGHRVDGFDEWTETTNDSKSDAVDSGFAGVDTDGNVFVDMDGSSNNLSLTQTVSGLADGASYLLEFDIARYNANISDPELAVYWNNNLVGTFIPESNDMQTISLPLIAIGGDNVIEFREIGTPDSTGTYLDNVVLHPSILSVDENSIDGTVVGQAFSTDPDGAAPVYSLVDGSVPFAIDSVTGEITVDGPIDYEALGASKTIDIEVKVIDQNGGEDVQTVSINVNDLNDNAPVLTVSNALVSINENSQGTTLAILSVADEDGTPPNAAQVIGNFTITGDDAALVEVVDNAGVFELRLKTNADLDFEEPNPILDVNVVYNDGVHNSNSEAVSVTVNDVNDHAPVVGFTAVVAGINELAPIGSKIGDISVNDIDTNGANPTLVASNFVIAGADASKVQVVETTPGVFELQLAEVLDSETPSLSSLDLTLTYDDGVNTPATAVDADVSVSGIEGSISITAPTEIVSNNFNGNSNNGWTTVGDSNTSGRLGWFDNTSDHARKTFNLNDYAGDTVKVSYSIQYWSLEGNEALKAYMHDGTSWTEVNSYSPSGTYAGNQDIQTFEITVPNSGSFELFFRGENFYPGYDFWAMDNFKITTISGDQVLTLDANDSGEIDMAALLSQANDFGTPTAPTSLDEIDLTAGAHILSNISADTVLSMVDTDNTLEIKGDNGDTIKLDLGADVANASALVNGDTQWHKDTSESTVTETVYVGKSSTDETITLLVQGINVEDTTI